MKVMDKNQTVIFCQAPADVPFVLSLYEEKQKTNRISIVVITVEGMFTFLKGLNLELEELTFIPYSKASLKKPLHVYNERKRIRALYLQHFAQLQNAEVYFCSRFEDWLTSALLHLLSKNKGVKIKYLNHYDDASNYDRTDSFSFRKFLYSASLKYLTGIKFTLKVTERPPEFPVEKYNIDQIRPIVNNAVFSKYVYHDTLIDRQKSNVLFFASDCQDLIYDRKYYFEVLINIINIFKQNGYCVILKGHPRINLPAILKSVADLEMPGYVPGEFIDVSDFAVCIGLDTNALSYFAKNNSLPTYSLIRMVPSISDRKIEILANYLKTQSDNRMVFIDNEEQLIGVVKKHLLQNVK